MVFIGLMGMSLRDLNFKQQKIHEQIHTYFIFLRNKIIILHVNWFEMNSKLTLNLNKNIIENAKDYAKDNRTSLSKLIENYLNSLTTKNNKEFKVSHLVESLTGIIPNPPKSFPPI